MATATFQSAPINDTLARFKTWAQGLSDALVAVGLTRTGDTGQVNWSSIASVPAASMPAWEVFSFGDSALPMYMKVLYGYRTSYTSCPYMGMIFGTGTDGAGTLANASPECVLHYQTSSSATLYNNYVSFATGVLTFCMWNASPGFTSICSVERSRDTSGTLSTLMWTVLWMSANAGTDYGTMLFRVPSPNGFGCWYSDRVLSLHRYAVDASQGLGGGLVCASPIFYTNGVMQPPGLAIHTMNGRDGSVDTNATINAYGTNHNYMLCKGGNYLILNTFNGASGTYPLTAMLYE